MTFLKEKISILTPKISDDLFFSHQPFFLTSSHILIYNVYDSFLNEKRLLNQNNSSFTPLFSLLQLLQTSNNTTSQNIGGTDAFWGPSPQPPRSPPMVLINLVSLIVNYFNDLLQYELIVRLL